jgi:hypothetical protein
VELAGAGIAGAFGYAPRLAAQPVDTSEADLVVVNAKVYTVDSHAPKAEAFAVKGSRFTAVGSSADIRGLIGKATQTYNAKQMAVVPGFIDCHNHAPRRYAALRRAGGQPLRCGVCHHRQHH